jgi:hypothetical protein
MYTQIRPLGHPKTIFFLNLSSMRFPCGGLTRGASIRIGVLEVKLDRSQDEREIKHALQGSLEDLVGASDRYLLT